MFTANYTQPHRCLLQTFPFLKYFLLVSTNSKNFLLWNHSYLFTSTLPEVLLPYHLDYIFLERLQQLSKKLMFCFYRVHPLQNFSGFQISKDFTLSPTISYLKLLSKCTNLLTVLQSTLQYSFHPFQIVFIITWNRNVPISSMNFPYATLSHNLSPQNLLNLYYGLCYSLC